MSSVLPPKEVVTCFLESQGKILIMLRSDKVRTYRGKWGGVAGYLETNPYDQALKEIREETGLSGNAIKLVKQGKPLTVEDKTLGWKWIVHPFLFLVSNPGQIKLDWEHDRLQWIDPDEMRQLDTVPGLIDAYHQVKN